VPPGRDLYEWDSCFGDQQCHQGATYTNGIRTDSPELVLGFDGVHGITSIAILCPEPMARALVRFGWHFCFGRGSADLELFCLPWVTACSTSGI